MGDFIDGSGQAWDIKGFQTFNPNDGSVLRPGRKGGFRLEDAVNNIETSLNNNEYVILDMKDKTQLSNRHAEDLQEAVEARGWEASGKVIFYRKRVFPTNK